MVQTDIKKVLAYSTISQLGYMFLGCGVGAFSAGVFHLMTHAFFKACSSSAPAASCTPWAANRTCAAWAACARASRGPTATMLAATLAIAGTPGFSGFFSKDEILLAAHSGAYAQCPCSTGWACSPPA